MSGIQIQGASATAEVETNSLALRVTPKPTDWGALGIYAIGANTGTMAAGLAANAPIFAFRNTTTNPYAIKKLKLSAGNTGTAFAAGICTFNLFVARSWSVSDSAGTSLTSPTKLKAAMAASGIGDMRVSSTATLTAGTRTKDSFPVASFTGAIVATAGSVLVPPTDIFVAGAADYPIVLGQNEGLVLEATVPGTGTWVGSISLVWEETSSYVP